MDFGGTLMSVCTPDFLRQMRQFLGYTLPPDRDSDDYWVDEAIQQYLQVDLRFVPAAPPLPILRDLDPAAAEALLADRARQRAAQDGSIVTTAVKHNHPLADKTLAELQTIKPQPQQPPRYLNWTIQQAQAYRAAGYATTYWVSGGFFEAGCYVRGYEQFAMDVAADPDIVRALFDVWLAEKLQTVELVIKPLAPYIDIFCFGDDLGLQNGPFMSPDTFRTLIKPYFDTHYSAVHRAAPNSYLFHHSCGSVYRLLDDLIAMGVNILNPIQPNAVEMEPERLYAKVCGRLCLHGGLDLQDLLPHGTPAQVRAEALRRIQVLGTNGGYICAPAHSLPEDVPLQNLLALFGRA